MLFRSTHNYMGCESRNELTAKGGRGFWTALVAHKIYPGAI